MKDVHVWKHVYIKMLDKAFIEYLVPGVEMYYGIFPSSAIIVATNRLPSWHDILKCGFFCDLEGGLR